MSKTIEDKPRQYWRSIARDEVTGITHSSFHQLFKSYGLTLRQINSLRRKYREDVIVETASNPEYVAHCQEFGLNVKYRLIRKS